jgi:PAS domain S-box-containing protein
MVFSSSNPSNIFLREAADASFSVPRFSLESAQWLVAQFPCAMMTMDLHLTCISVNQQWQALMHSSLCVEPGQTFPVKKLPQSWQAKIHRGFQGIKSSTDSQIVEIQGDAYGLMQCRIIPCSPTVGTVEGILICAEVVQESDPEATVQQLVAHFHRTEKHLQTILDHVPGVIHLKDLEGHFLYVSGQARNDCENEPSDVAGKTSEELFPPNVASSFRKMDAQVIQTGLLCRSEDRVPHPDGTPHLYRTVKFPLKEKDGTLYAIGGISTDITAEAALIESEAKYRQLVEQVDDIIYSITLQGVLSYVSPRCQALIGYAPGDLIGQSYESLIHPEDLVRCRKSLKDTLEQGSSVRGIALQVKHKHGGWKWLSCSNSPTRDLQGNIIGLQGIATDITELKAAEAKRLEVEAALHQSEKLLLNLAENVPGMLYQVTTRADGTLHFSYVSSGCRELYGLESEEILQNPQWLIEAVHPDDRASIFAAIAHAAETLQVWQWEGRIILPSGQTKWVQSFAKSEYQPDGTVIWHGFTFDISEQHATQCEREWVEEALRLSDARLRTVINTAPVILYAFDRNGQFTFSEGKGLDAFGLQPGEVVGQSVFDLYQNYPDILENTSRAIAGEINRYVTCIEGRYYETFFNPIFNELGEVAEIIAASVDVTEQKQSETELQQALITEERNRMAREIHDTLAQALTGIFIQLGAASRLLSQDPVAAQQHIEHARTVARSGVAEARRSVEALRSQLLEEGDLCKALSQLVRQLSALTEATITFSFTDDPYHLPADIENNLLRIVQEALTNSIRHALASCIKVDIHYLSDACVLQVKDDGQGFEMDVRSPERGYGILGMQERSTCIGAIFDMQSLIGEGTTITVRIPRQTLGQENNNARYR